MSGRDKLHENILTYHRLKEVWGLGHIGIKINKCELKFNDCPGLASRVFRKQNEHTAILGYYVHNRNRMAREILRDTFEEALRRMNLSKHIVCRVTGPG